MNPRPGKTARRAAPPDFFQSLERPARMISNHWKIAPRRALANTLIKEVLSDSMFTEARP